MLTMRDHDIEDYVALRDMDATDAGMLSADDLACLDELGDYLVSTDAFQRFAIWLLHKHFEPASGEVFAESVITAPRGTKTTPVKRCFAQGLNATSMRFSTPRSVGRRRDRHGVRRPGRLRLHLAAARRRPDRVGVAERLRASPQNRAGPACG